MLPPSRSLSARPRPTKPAPKACQRGRSPRRSFLVAPTTSHALPAPATPAHPPKSCTNRGCPSLPPAENLSTAVQKNNRWHQVELPARHSRVRRQKTPLARGSKRKTENPRTDSTPHS